MMPYYYSYDYAYSTANLSRILAILGAYWLFGLAVWALGVIANWKIYTKAGEEGWASLVPFYNRYTLYKISWGNGWYFFLEWIPLAGIVFWIITQVKLAKAFGKGGGFACGLIFLNTIFIMIMGFSADIQYAGVDGSGYSAPPPGGGYQNPYYGAQNNPNQSYNAGGFTPPPPPAAPYTQGSAQNPDYHYQRAEPPQQPRTESQRSPGGYCSQCGAKLEEGAKFCPGCGKQL